MTEILLPKDEPFSSLLFHQLAQEWPDLELVKYTEKRLKRGYINSIPPSRCASIALVVFWLADTWVHKQVALARSRMPGASIFIVGTRSTSKSSKAHVEMLRLGADCFFPAPTDTELLIETARMHIRKHKASAIEFDSEDDETISPRPGTDYLFAYRQKAIQERIGQIVEDIVILQKEIQGENRYTSELFKDQLVSVLQKVLKELQSPSISRTSVRQDAGTISKAGKAFAKKAGDQSIARIAKRVVDALYDLIAQGLTGT